MILLKLNNLDKTYNKGSSNQIHAIDNTSLVLPNNGMIAFFGKSGCGKTTLLNVIGGLDTVNKGEVILDGEIVKTNSNEVRNRKIGYIFQNYYLSKQMTVFENVAMSLKLCGMTNKEEIQKRVATALRAVGMEKYINRNPDALSGGQQQRVAIARAIVKNPAVILADEPTGNLDEHNTVMVMDLLKELSKDHLVLLVTHEADLVDHYCDRVIEIVDGKIISDRTNENANGYFAKSKNDVYLGDMEKTEISNDCISLDYYGDRPDNLNIRLISSGGVLYIDGLGDKMVKIINSSTEINIHEGKYIEAGKERKRIDIDGLCEVKDGKTGRMFNFFGAVKTGFFSNFKKKKGGSKLLIPILVLFAISIVVIVSIFGQAIYEWVKIEDEYDKDMICLSNNKGALDASDLKTIVDSGCVDAVSIIQNSNGVIMNFGVGHFESISQGRSDLLFIKTKGYVLPVSVMRGKLEKGSDKIENAQGAIITTKLADALIKESYLDYIKTYDDLLYLDCNLNGLYNSVQVVGIVEEESSRIYIDNCSYATSEMSMIGDLQFASIQNTSDKEFLGLEAPDKGKIYINRNRYYSYTCFEDGKTVTKRPDQISVGDIVYINDIAFTVEKTVGELANMSNPEYEKFLYDRYKMTDDSFVSFCNMAYPEEETSDFVREEYETWKEIVYTEFIEHTVGYSSYSSTPIVVNDEDIISLQKYISHEIGAKWGYMSFFAHDRYDELSKLAHDMANGNNADDILLVNAETIRENLLIELRPTLVGLTIALVITVGLLSLCLYFIMRSALMKSVKEIGICRAIGVSRKNIVFRYAVESGVLFALTTFLGYLFTSLLMRRLMEVRGVESMMYYPVWLSLITFAFIAAVSIFCGILPVTLLLKKTPSAILSKYDI